MYQNKHGTKYAKIDNILYRRSTPCFYVKIQQSRSRGFASDGMGHGGSGCGRCVVMGKGIVDVWLFHLVWWGEVEGNCVSLQKFWEN